MQILLIIVYSIITIVFISYFLKGIKTGNPVFLFSIFNWIMAVGSFSLMDFSLQADIVHTFVLFFTQIFFFLGAIVVFYSRKGILGRSNLFFSQKIQSNINTQTFFYILFIFLVSLIISGLYFKAIGYNTFLTSLTHLYSKGFVIDDLSTMRLESYAGERYFAPGYVNQFKNMLLPLSLITLYIYSVLKNKKNISRLCIIASPVVLIMLLGTGQRGAFVLVVLVIVVCITLILKSSSGTRLNHIKYKFKKAKKTLFISALIIFMVSTVAGGRAGEGNFLIGAIEGILHRIFNSNQLSSVTGFRYVYDLEVVWGYEWLESIRGILPGVDGSDLSNRIFQLLYGSMRGTSPISVWGSVWHNSSWLGVVVFPFILGVVYAKSYINFISKTPTDILFVSYAAASIILSVWIAGSAVQLVNNGLIAVILFYFSSNFLYRLTRKKSSSYPL